MCSSSVVKFRLSQNIVCVLAVFFFFQAEDGIRDLVRSRGLGDVYKRQPFSLRLKFRMANTMGKMR